MTETTGRGKQFLKSVGIYAVGNIGSKLITFLMIPLYTFFVETSEFGYYDLCLTAVMLLTSFASLQLRDGAFRFLIDSKTDEEKTEEAAEPLVARFHAVVGDCVVCLSDKVPVALVRLVGLDGID